MGRDVLGSEARIRQRRPQGKFYAMFAVFSDLYNSSYDSNDQAANRISLRQWWKGLQ
jgi:hypothetical protein